MTKIIKFHYDNVDDYYMLSNKTYQLHCEDINRFLAISKDKVEKHAKLVLTKNNTYKTSKWRLLQSIKYSDVLLYNEEAKTIITKFNDGTIVLSSLDFSKVNYSYNIKTKQTINSSISDIWWPKSNSNISPKIAFWNASNSKGILCFDDSEDTDILIHESGTHEAYFKFIYNGKYVDYPGNCVIDGLTKTLNINCHYFNLQTGGKYCFTQSSTKFIIKYKHNNTVLLMDATDLNQDNQKMERYGNGATIRVWSQNLGSPQQWYILKDNFNRILLRPIDKETLLDIHNGAIGNRAQTMNNWNSVHKNNIYTITSDNSIQIVNYEYDGYLAPTNSVEKSLVILSNKKTKWNFSTIYSPDINIDFNQINFKENGYSNIDTTLIKSAIINPPFSLSGTNTFNDIQNEIIKNKYNYSNTKPITLNEIKQNFFDKVKLENIDFSYNNGFLDIIKTIINLEDNPINNNDYPFLNIIFELYNKIKNNASIEKKSIDFSEFILDNDGFINNSNKLYSLGWDRYLPIIEEENIIDPTYLSNSINYLLTKLNIFIIHVLDKFIYNSDDNLSNDFMSLFTSDNKLCSFAITTNLLYAINKTLGTDFKFKTILPTFDLSQHNNQGGIAYWKNKDGYWCGKETDINWSIIECNDNKNSHWNDKNNESIISTDKFNNVFRLYTNIENNSYITSEGAENLNTTASINTLKSSHDHVIKSIYINNQYINNQILCHVRSNENGDLKIGTRFQGNFIKIGECEILKAYIYVSDKGDKLWGETSSNDKVKFVTNKCSDGGDADGHINKDRKPHTKYDIPKKVEMRLYSGNKLVKRIEFDDYKLGYAAHYGGCDQHAYVCSGWGGKDRCITGYSDDNIKEITRKLKLPIDLINGSYKVYDNDKTYYMTNSFKKYINNNRSKLLEASNLFPKKTRYGSGSADGGGIYGDDDIFVKDHWENDKYFLKELANDPNWGKHTNYNNGEFTYYGNMIVVENAFTSCANPDISGGFYSGNVYSKEPEKCKDDDSDCVKKNKQYLARNNDESNARCFVVPNNELKISLFDDRFDYMLLYWLDQNKDSLSNVLKDEVIKLFNENPQLLLRYRIYKNYVGCTKNNYINLENVMGPPLIYVPKSSNLTEYTCYYAESSLSKNSKEIKKNDIIISKFTSELINPTNFLDKLYYSFTNLSNTNNIDLNNNFYVYLPLHFNFSDLLKYINPENKTDVELKILADITNVESLNNNYGFLISNSSVLSDTDNTKFTKIGKYLIPFISNSTSGFKFSINDVYFFFYSNYNSENGVIDLTDNNINMVFRALTKDDKKYNVIRMTSTYNKTEAENQAYLVPIDRSSF